MAIWILENGNVGCMPDNIDEYHSRAAAHDAALALFAEGDYSFMPAEDARAARRDERAMRGALRKSGDVRYYFDTTFFGADYVEIREKTAQEYADDLLQEYADADALDEYADAYNVVDSW